MFKGEKDHYRKVNGDVGKQNVSYYADIFLKYQSLLIAFFLVKWAIDLTSFFESAGLDCF